MNLYSKLPKNSDVIEIREQLSGKFYDKALTKLKSEQIQDCDKKLRFLRFKMFNKEATNAVINMFKDIAEKGKEKYEEYNRKLELK